MNTYIAFALGAIIALCTSCSSSTAPLQQPEQAEFWPLAQGSSWTYGGISSYTLTVVGDSTINSRVYTKAARSTGGYDLFFMSEGGMLYVRERDGNEVPVLLNGAPFGKTWTYKRIVRGVAVTYEHVVAELNGIRTVHDTTYKDVQRIDVYEVEDARDNAHHEPEKKLVMSRYYARAVGLIESDAGTWGKVYLTTYHLP